MFFKARNLLVLSVILIIVSATPSAASFERKGGIRALGMGEAFTGVADDASAPYWNPAGIGRFSAVEFRAEYARPFAGAENVEINDMDFAFAYPFGNWGTMLGGYNYLGNYLYSEGVGTFSYGVGLFKRKPLLIGLNTRLYSVGYSVSGLSSIDAGHVKKDPLFSSYGYGESAFGFDLGAMYRYRDIWTVGVSVFNLNEPCTSLNPEDNDKLPITGRIGVSYTYNKFLGAFDLEYRDQYFMDSKPVYIHAGLEQELFKKRLHLRAGAFGMVSPEISTNLTAGFSYNFLRKEWVEFGTDLLDGKDYQYLKRLWLTLEYGAAFPIGSGAFEGSYGDQRIGLKVTFDTSKEYKKYMTRQELEEMLKDRKIEVALDITETILEKEFEIIEGEKEMIEQELQERFDMERQELMQDLAMQQELELEQKRIEQDLMTAGQQEELEEQIRQLQEIIRKQQRAIEMSTKTNEALQHLMLAVRYYFLQQYGQAEKECYIAIELAPHISLAFKRLGSIYYKQGRYSDANAAWKKALEIDPTDDELKIWLERFRKGKNLE